MSDPASASDPAWHALFAPLPPDARLRRQPVVSAEILAAHPDAGLDGWESIVLELSAGEQGRRIVMVTRDAAARVVSASDWVMRVATRTDDTTGARVVEYRHETVGGRFDDDGRFLGTRWHTTQVVREEEDEEEPVSEPSVPSAEDEAGMRRTVAALLKLVPPGA